MDQSASFPRRIAEAARAMQEEAGSVATMDLAVQLALEVVAGADDASISLVQRGRIVETPATTSDRAAAVDRIQYELGEGPLLADIWDQEVVSCPDLAADTRWGQWGPRAAEESGIGSVLCFRMFATRGRMGALSLYATEPGAFTFADIESGVSFAAHTAIAIIVAQDEEHKDLALDSRSLIGQATGIVMERYGLDAVRAFGVLKRISQDSNVKVHEVAAGLIRTRSLPS